MKWIKEVLNKAPQKTRPQRQEKNQLLEPGRLVDGELELVLFRSYHAKANNETVPTYRFKMFIGGEDGEEVGRIDLRVRDTERIIMYLGHIGYRVSPKYRGSHYAARATRLLLPLARSHGMETLWITCNPENFPSRRTCELAGAILVEIVDVPKNSDFYTAGEKQKCRYRLDL